MDKYPVELLDDLDRYADEALKAALEYGEMKEAYNMLDKRKDIKKADIISRMVGKSYAEKERMALLTDEWGNYVDNCIVAEKLKDDAMARRDDAERRWEGTRTKISNKNTEIRFASGGM